MSGITVATRLRSRRNARSLSRGERRRASGARMARVTTACILVLAGAGCLPIAPGAGWCRGSRRLAIWRTAEVDKNSEKKTPVQLLFYDLPRKRPTVAATMLTTGGAVTLSRPVWSPNEAIMAWVQWSALDGRSEHGGVFRVWIASAEGRRPRVLAEFGYPAPARAKRAEPIPAAMLPPCWSPDGTTLYVSGSQGTYAVPLDGTKPRRIAKALLLTIAVSPDGKMLAGIHPVESPAVPPGRTKGSDGRGEGRLDFSSEKGSTRLVFLSLPDGRRTEVNSFAEKGKSVIGLSWASVDMVVAAVAKEIGDGSLWMVSTSGKTKLLVGTRAGALFPAVSPDDARISYVRVVKTDSSLRGELRLLDLTSKEDRLLYSTASEHVILWPRWSADGKWVAVQAVPINDRYRRTRPKTVLVPIKGKPVLLDVDKKP